MATDAKPYEAEARWLVTEMLFDPATPQGRLCAELARENDRLRALLAGVVGAVDGINAAQGSDAVMTAWGAFYRAIDAARAAAGGLLFRPCPSFPLATRTARA